jgi:hypothetical protein
MRMSGFAAPEYLRDGSYRLAVRKAAVGLYQMLINFETISFI